MLYVFVPIFGSINLRSGIGCSRGQHRRSDLPLSRFLVCDFVFNPRILLVFGKVDFRSALAGCCFASE